MKMSMLRNKNMKSAMNMVFWLAIFPLLVLSACSGDAFYKYEVNRSDYSVPYMPSTDSPAIVSVVATAKDKIVVTFNEELDETTATEYTNYYVQGMNRVNVLPDPTPVLSDDKKSVTLTLSTGILYGMHTGRDYTLLVQRVADRDGNAILNAFANFTGLGSVVAEVYRGSVKMPVSSPYPAFNTSSVQFTVQVAGVSSGSYSYSLDGGAFSGEIDINEPLELSGLSEGYHSLKVIGKNGETGEWQELNQATETQFIIDTIPPVSSLSHTPPTVTSSGDIAILVSGNDVSKYTYRINSGSESDEISVSNAIVKKNLPDGEYTLYVWGIDAAGNRQLNPTTYAWTVSTTKPTAELINKPARYTRLRFATFVVGGTDVNFYRYKINNESWSGYESVANYIELSNLPDGDYTITVIGASRNGDPSSEGLPLTYTWTIDNVAPESVITNLPANPTNSQKTSILVSSNTGDVVSYRYRLIVNGVVRDLSGIYSISAPIELASLGEGTYTIKVMGIDAAGNMQSEENASQWTWTVDMTPPRATLSNLPPANTSSVNINVGVGPSGDAMSYKYILDGVSWSSEILVLNNIVRNNLADGTYTLSVVVRDNAGNWQSLQDPTRHVFTVDTVPPVITLSNKPPVITSNPNADIVVGGSGVVRYRYRINGGSWSEEYDRYLTPSIQYVNLPDGEYTLEVIGVDLAGNWQSTPTSHHWTVDSNYTSPVAQLSNLPANPTNNRDISVVVDGSIVSYKYKIDGSNWSDERDITTPIEETGLSDGSHTILVIGKNSSGIWQPTDNATEYTWIIDTVSPFAELSNMPSSPTNDNSISITVSGIGVVAYKYSFDDSDPRGGTEYPVSVPIAMSNISNGPHTIYVIARDDAGNWQNWQQPTTCAWTVDTSVPTAEFVSGTLPDPQTNVTFINISVGGSGVVSYKYRLDENPSWSAEFPISTPISRIGLANGSHSVRVIGKNSTGTWQPEVSATTYNWEIDTTPPSASDIVLGNLPSNPTAETSIDITVGGTGITYYRYKLDNESWSASIPVEENITRSGLLSIEHTIYVVACDNAGNWLPYESAKSYTWVIDTANPIAEIQNPPDNPTNKNYATLNIGGAQISQYKYSFNGGAWSSWISISTPISLSSLADTTHTIQVCGQTNLGQEQSEANATTYSWTVDTQAPTAVLSDLPSNPTTNTTASIKVSGEGVTGYRYKIDGGEWQPAGSEYNVSARINLALNYGDHSLQVIGRDLAGNWQTVPTSYSWTINEPEMVSPKTYDAGDFTSSAKITFSWIRPSGCGDVKIQIASDSSFTNIVYGETNGTVIGNVDSFDFVVSSTEIQTYYARVSVNKNSGMPANDPSWKAWGEASNGITVTGAISGTVLDGVTRSAINGATVELRRSSDNYLVATTSTDLNGEFAFVGAGIGTNYYRAIIAKSGYVTTSRNNITVALGETTNIGISYLIPTNATAGTITGRSIDANDATYLQNTKVEVFDWQNALMDTKYTGSDGKFTTATLNPGVYSIKFSRANYYDLVVDNVIVNGNKDISNQAICAYLIEPQVRVIVLWGPRPRDLDLHVVGPSAKTVTETYGSGPANRFHVGYVTPWQYNFNEATGTYEWSNPDRDGTRSTTALVQDVYPGNPLTPNGGFGPEAINLWRYGGVQYARGIYTYTVRNYSETDWYAGNQNITLRVYDSLGMRREVIMPTGASDPGNTTRDWKALKINIQGNTREKRYLYVPSQSVFFNAGADNNKAGFDW